MMGRSSEWWAGVAITLVAMWGAGTGPGVHAEDDLDRQLLESLEGGRPPDSPVDVVHRLLKNTDAARRRLEEGRFDEQTASLQQQILDDLDALLEQSGPSPPPAGASPQAGAADQRSDPQTASGPQSSASAAGDSPTPESGTTADADPNAASRESTERTTAARESAAERERRLGLATAAWGHLPPKVREQMRSAFSETYLPKYDELLRRYYEALATQRAGPARRDPPRSPSVPD